MARYIDAEQMKIEIKIAMAEQLNKDPFDTFPTLLAELLCNFVDVAPTADVVEVVRCEDCKCCEQCYPAKAIGKEAIVGWYCNLNSKYVLPTHYCGYGERRDG